ncbi:MAG: pantoate--beta-alanine ligase, partial [Acidimicrobiia bacterium]
SPTHHSVMQLARTFADARAGYRGRVALVPTMGFFHEGHLALMRAAKATADTLIVSVFVNPLQFDDPSDLDRYPRDLDRDLAMAEAERVDIVFAPPLADMYPDSPRTRVTVADVAASLEGPHRPGHFEGVATVVAKLFAGLQPRSAHFGRKDAQQLAVVRTLAADLSFPVTVIGHPTVREADGLALSSRNVLLEQQDRPGALLLSKGLFAAAELAESGERSATRLEQVVGSIIQPLEVDYVELAAQNTAELLDQLDRPSFLAAAVRVGSVRLIDNVAFDLIGGEVMADRGVRLQQPSMLYS